MSLCRNFVVVASVWLLEFRVAGMIDRRPFAPPTPGVGLSLVVAFKPRLVMVIVSWSRRLNYQSSLCDEFVKAIRIRI